MHNVVIPNLTLDNLTIFDLSSELKSINLATTDTICFDFSRVYTFQPFPMLFIGAIIRNFCFTHPNIKFTYIESKYMSYAENMGFIQYMFPSNTQGKTPGSANSNSRFIAITPIQIGTMKKFTSPSNYALNLEQKAKSLSKVIAQNNSNFHLLYTYLIRELMRNTAEHADIDTIWICGQFWPSYNKAQIAILDEGIGIYESLAKNTCHKKYIHDNESAIEWALKAGISSAFNPRETPNECNNSGFGLYVTNKICNYLNGLLTLASYNNYLQTSKISTHKGPTYFHGTAIGMVIDTRKLNDAEGIISDFINDGEIEASKLRNTYKKASKPSKTISLS